MQFVRLLIVPNASEPYCADQTGLRTFAELPVQAVDWAAWGCPVPPGSGDTKEKPFQVVDLEGLSWLRG